MFKSKLIEIPCDVREQEWRGMVVEQNGLTMVRALELVRGTAGSLIFKPHEYVGRETDLAYVYAQIKEVASKLDISAYIHSNACSDEENSADVVTRLKVWDSPFRLDVPGTIASRQAIGVALTPGHSSNIIEINTHCGVYKHKDGRILMGMVESERDHVLRPTCGALSHIAKRFLGKEQSAYTNGELDFIGILEHELAPFKDEFLKIYNSGVDDADKMSKCMEYLAWTNCRVQVDRAVRFVQELNPGSPTLVFGSVTLNRFRYCDTNLLQYVCLVKNGQVYDLSKRAV